MNNFDLTEGKLYKTTKTLYYKNLTTNKKDFMVPNKILFLLQKKDINPDPDNKNFYITTECKRLSFLYGKEIITAFFTIENKGNDFQNYDEIYDYFEEIKLYGQ